MTAWRTVIPAFRRTAKSPSSWGNSSQHSDGDGDAGQDRLGEGSADREPVDKVVDPVAKNNHPSNGRDFASSPLDTLQFLHRLDSRPRLRLRLVKNPKRGLDGGQRLFVDRVSL